jgi:hypothetical protein
MTNPSETNLPKRPPVPFAVALGGLALVTLVFYTVPVILLHVPSIAVVFVILLFNSIVATRQHWKDYSPGQQVALDMAPITVLLATAWGQLWWQQGTADLVALAMTCLIWGLLFALRRRRFYRAK